MGLKVFLLLFLKMEDWNLFNAYEGTRTGEEGLIYGNNGIMSSLEVSEGVRDGGGSRGLIWRTAVIILGGLLKATFPKCIIIRIIRELRKKSDVSPSSHSCRI